MKQLVEDKKIEYGDGFKNFDIYDDKESPLPLVGFTTVYSESENIVYLYGGEGKYSGRNGELYELNLSSIKSKWTQIKTFKTPTERSYHCMSEIFLDKNDRAVYIFGGGEGFWGTPSNNFYKLNIDKREFQKIDVINGPSARWRHTCGLVGKKLYIFGGDNLKGVFGDLWVFNPDVGFKQIITKNYPQPRIYSNILSCKERKKLYLVGGCKGNIIDPYKEFWEYDIKEKNWKQLTLKFGIEPYELPFWIPSKEFGSILIGNKIIMCGGETLMNDEETKPFLDDILIYNLDTNDLFFAYEKNDILKLHGHKLVLIDDRLVVIGGQHGFNSFHNLSELKLLNSNLESIFFGGNLFNISLEEIMKIQKNNSLYKDLEIPYILNDIFDFLESFECFKCEGLFRISGSQVSISKYKLKYENNIKVNLRNEKDVHVVSGLFKNFLSTLPEPLLTYNLFNEIFNTSLIDDSSKKIEEIVNIFKNKLPKTNYLIVKRLVIFCSKVVKNLN